MKPEKPLTPREKIEVGLTALLMGELPPEEAAALQAWLAADPELAALHGRLRKATDLLREAIAFPESSAPSIPVQLSSERRERLLAHFKAPVPAPAIVIGKPRRDWSWLMPLSLAAAVIVAVGGGLMMPTFSSVQRRSASTVPPPLFKLVPSGPVGSFGYHGTEVHGHGVGALGPVDSSSVGGSFDAPTAHKSIVLSTPAPQLPQYYTGYTGLTASNGGSLLTVMPPPKLMPISPPDRPLAAAAAPPAKMPSGYLNLGKATVASTPATKNVFLGGGTQGTSPALNSADFPFVVPGTDETTANVQVQDRAIPEEQKQPFFADVNGAGTLVLSGGNTYAGGTTVAGTVVGSLGTNQSGDGIVTLNPGANAYTGTTAVNGGTLSVGGVTKTGTGTVTLAGNSNTGDVDLDGFANKDEFRAGTNGRPVAGSGTPSAGKPQTVGGRAGGKVVESTEGLAAVQLLQNEFKRGEAPRPQVATEITTDQLARQAAEIEFSKDGFSRRLTAGNATDALLFPVDGKDQAASPVAKAPAPAEPAPARPGIPEPVQSLDERDKMIPGAAGSDTKQLFSEAQKLYDTGRFVQAKKRTEQILNADPNNQAASQFEKKIDKALSDYGVASYNETRASRIAETDRAWARPIRKPEAVVEIQQNNPKELDFGWLKDVKAPEETGPLVAQSRGVRQDIPKLVEDMIAAAPKNEEIRSLLAKYRHVDKQSAVPALNMPALNSVSSGAPAQAPAPIDSLARTEIAQKAGANLLRDLAVASLKNKEIRDLLAKHGYTVQQPATPVPVVTKSEEEAPAKAASSPAPIPQPEIQTSENAFSTFSLNVSDVSFKLAAVSLANGKMPDPATVRSEEFVNAFDYRDPEPEPGAPLAFATDRARYPFAQNRDLLRFAVKTAAAGRQAGRPLNIVLLLDKSGSMERADRVNIVREALRVLAAQLQPQDKLSIVTFARAPRLWADGVAGDKAGEIIARVGEITPEGGTNLEAALDLGYATARRHYAVGSINRVVLFTDGAANLGDVDPDALTKKVEAHRKQGVALDCFGIGWEGYNDDLLEQLTRHGDGRYGFINTPDEAAENFAAQLAGALQVAASDVKVQVEFNPHRVTAYRQIGYAKHQLTKEQFRDNTVAAAQIGAAESGNALYVVEVNPHGEGDLATVRVRFRVPGTDDVREHEWPVPFTGNAPPLEQASSALRLAGTAAAFSEMLAASPYAAEVTNERLLGVLNGVPAIYGADPRPKKLEWMIRQALSLSGR